MVTFKLTILGSGSALPTLHRNPTSQLLQYDSLCILLDCAEGTQLQLKRFKKSPMQIAHILISHLHGDHYFGLIGLITSLHLMGRTKPLHIYGPAQLFDIIQLQLNAAKTKLHYPLSFEPLNPDGQDVIFEDDKLTIDSFPVKHRIPTWGFLFKEKPSDRRINKDFIAEYNPDIEQCKAIKSGADFVQADGSIVPNERITSAPHPPRSYAFCTDTAYTEAIVPIIEKVTLLYHESTFVAEMSEEADQTYHSTTAEAARIAHLAKADKLILGHYSSRYRDTKPLEDEAKKVFPNTIAADDGLEIHI